MNTTAPSEVRLKTYQTLKYHIRWTSFTHNTHALVRIPVHHGGNCCGPHSGPIEPAARTPPVPAAAAPRARITSFFSGSFPPTGTGTGAATPAVDHTPTTATSTGEAQKALLAEAPNTSATGPETPAAAPESPATTIPTSGETMLPGESHEWLGNDGEGLFTDQRYRYHTPCYLAESVRTR